MALKISKSGIVSTMMAHKALVYILVAALSAVGILGLFKMNKDEFPTFDLKLGLVAGVYPGATSEEVENQLTEPLENILFSMKEVSRSKTYSYSKDGICYIYVDLDCEPSKKDEVWSKIKLKLSQAKATLPSGVLAVAVIDEFSNTSALLIALQARDKGFSELKEYSDELSRRLRKIPELASVKAIGEQSEEIAITLDKDRLTAYGISPSSLLLNYQSSALSVPAGRFTSDLVSSPIHITNPVATEGEIAETVVYCDPSGAVVRLKDVATIERRMAGASSYVNYNGSSAVILSVEMRSDNNIVAFGEKVDKVLAQFESELPSSVVVTKITDQPKVVERSVMGFLRDLLISMLVVIVVMLLLFPIRSALISSSGIPIIIAIAIAVMYLFGMALHTVTLAALITVLGMIVDDSVITMDGYMDKLGRGLKPQQAAAASVKELFMPMLMATLAIGLMFFPVDLIITGYLGDFCRTFPPVVFIALMISLVYAICVVPTLMTRFITKPQADGTGWFARLQARFFAFLQGIYEAVLRFCFNHTKATIIGGVVAVGCGILMFATLNIQMMPMASRDCFAIEVTADAGSPLTVTRSIVDSLETLMLADSRVKSVTSFIGESAPRFMATYSPKAPQPNFAQVIVGTKSNMATEAILADWDSKIHTIFPNALIRLKQIDYQGVNAQVEVKLSGAPRSVLNPVADTIKAYMRSMPSLQWIHSDNDAMLSCVNVELSNEEASSLGVNRSMVALSLAGAFEGTPLATVYEGACAIPVKLYSASRDVDYETVGNQMVPTLRPGVTVPLRQVASIEPQWCPEVLARYGGEETVVVAADMKYARSHTAAMKEIKKFIDASVRPGLPEGVQIEYGGLSSSNKQVGPEILLSFVAAVLVLFTFLMIHFKKLSLAVMSVGMSALCLFGSSFGLWIFGMDFGITCALGLISLVGIIIRNGIILFDYAEELVHDKGLSVSDAAFEAGCRRFRPIFLTSITTALGVLPMVLNGGPLWQPMGLVISFGTVLSILLVVLIMPVTYKIVFRNHAPAK